MQEILVRPAVYSLNKRKWIEQDLIKDAHLRKKKKKISGPSPFVNRSHSRPNTASISAVVAASSFMMPIRFNSAFFAFSTARNLSSVFSRDALVAISFRFLARRRD